VVRGVRDGGGGQCVVASQEASENQDPKISLLGWGCFFVEECQRSFSTLELVLNLDTLYASHKMTISILFPPNLSVVIGFGGIFIVTFGILHFFHVFTHFTHNTTQTGSSS
jgi:hypothetical protein